MDLGGDIFRAGARALPIDPSPVPDVAVSMHERELYSTVSREPLHHVGIDGDISQVLGFNPARSI